MSEFFPLSCVYVCIFVCLKKKKKSPNISTLNVVSIELLKKKKNWFPLLIVSI